MTHSKILVTGAAGYVGGSVLSYLKTLESSSIDAGSVIGAVRSEEQVDALTAARFNVQQVNLSDEQAVAELVLRNEIDVVVHCASGLDRDLVVNLIHALGKRREASGKATYFIHTSGGSAFSEVGGWSNGPTSDTDQIFDLEKALADSMPLRKVDVAVTEEAKSAGVTSYIVVPPMVYGRGLGLWNKLSVCMPLTVRASLSRRAVYTFPQDSVMPAVHVSDLMALYARLLEKIVQNDAPAGGENGYYFAVAHKIHWWPTLDRMAAALHSRGLVQQRSTQMWPNDEEAAEAYGLPGLFVQMIFNSRTEIRSGKAGALGWEPTWTQEDQFLQIIDDEVRDVLELDTGKGSVLNNVNKQLK
ncbi:hypothetical protein BDY17DRAFT_298706 [Neohortaea acidophila]|uniref:NAD-dependent epimerase/dehydratase domain-containing protein n=1 Tax=Neohortaea acidophila TaxID=245834 RepID=A0A6A6PS66_9PEZI|nr:uncharacterized protein BDY17DRAFT_298706 [Neohortaea acidophila]KAF2482541.1 hypothetical protein BDY17DRAFT_298706 [Neohortaea acidophila]